MADLSVEISGIKFQNPVMVSAGTFGYGDEFADIIDVNRLGGIVTKTLTLNPREGNPSPRVIPTPSGMLNSIGLQNMGIEKFIQEKLPKLKSSIKIPIIVSIMGESVEEFIKIATQLNSVEGISAIELNLSCPNVRAGGMIFSISPELTYEVIKSVKEISKYPVFAKLTPNVTDISTIAISAEKGGANAVVAINTFLGMSIDIKTRQSKLGTITGGLSGPAIKPLALSLVYKICKAVKIPIIGTGGILTGEDAIEYIIAGVTAISVGTGNFIDPHTPIKVLEGIEKYMNSSRSSNLQEIRGTFKEK